MYDFIDRPVAELPATDRATLLAMRRWVHALTLAGHAPIGPDATRFDAVMAILERDSVDELVFQRPCHTVVEDIEAVLVGLWRLVRVDRIAPACAAATSLVGPSAARALIEAMVRATGELAG